MVAVVVPSPACSEVFEATSRTICAPMFSNLFSSSISLATVTPSLVTRGAPNDYRAPHYGPWGRELPAPRRRECRSRASFCHEHRPRISLPWQPCRTPEGLIALLCCKAARLFHASPEGSVRRREFSG